MGIVLSIMGDSPDPRRPKDPSDRLRCLADAYEVRIPTLDSIADVIVARTKLVDGEYARGSVLDLLGLIVEDSEIFAALEKGEDLSKDLLKRMADVIASDPPANVPEWDFLQLVLDDVRSVLST